MTSSVSTGDAIRPSLAPSGPMIPQRDRIDPPPRDSSRTGRKYASPPDRPTKLPQEEGHERQADAPSVDAADIVAGLASTGTSRLGRAWRMRRGLSQAKRLREDATCLARLYGAVVEGPDTLLEQGAKCYGLGADAVASVRVRFRGRRIGLLLPTGRTWRNRISRRYLNALAERAFAAGRLAYVVDPTIVGRRPRIENARRILFEGLPAADCDVAAVGALMAGTGGHATWAECAAALTPGRVEGRMLGLVAAGVVGFALNGRLDGSTPIRAIAAPRRLAVRYGACPLDDAGPPIGFGSAGAPPHDGRSFG